MDLLSASKYWTPAPGVHCNDALRCWIPSNDVIRKVTTALDSSHGVLPSEHKPKIAHAHYNGFAIHYFFLKNLKFTGNSTPQLLHILATERQAYDGFGYEAWN